MSRDASASGGGRITSPPAPPWAAAKLRGRTAMRSEPATSGTASANEETTRLTRRSRPRAASASSTAPRAAPASGVTSTCSAAAKRSTVHRPRSSGWRARSTHAKSSTNSVAPARPRSRTVDGTTATPPCSRRDAATSTVWVRTRSRARGARAPSWRSRAGRITSATRSDVVSTSSPSKASGWNGALTSSRRSAAARTSRAGWRSASASGVRTRPRPTRIRSGSPS
jgi:hypothetical protein